jgi:hypothetical protein
MRTTTSLSPRGRRTPAGRHPLARTAPLAAAVATVLALGAAGCGNGGTGGTGTAAATSTRPSAPDSAAPTTTGDSASPSAAPQGTTAPGTTAASPHAVGGGTPATVRAEAAGSRCTVTDLAMRLGRGDPGAGQLYYPLLFTNTSSHACVLDGFPGVSLIRGDGSTIGRPAGREGPKGAVVSLKPGATVEADLHTLNQGVRGDSCWGRPTLVKAYPPGSRDAMTLATSDPVVCGDTFEVGSVH